MAQLATSDYLRHIETESRRFRDVLAACDPSAPVPSCPDWTATDLLWHLARVQWFWGTIILTRPAPPEGGDDDGASGPERPTTYDGILAAYDEYSALLLSELAAADPAEHAWTWSDDHTVGFIHRRQAHEALIHRLDAELAAGTPTAFDPELAADGVVEVLDVMYGGCPPWGTFTPSDQIVRVDLADTAESVWVRLGQFHGTDPQGTVHDGEDLHVIEDPGVEPAVVISGPAGSLDAWLWRRGDDEEITVTGDPAVYDQFRACVNYPID